MINLFFVVHDHSGARTYADQLLCWLATQEGFAINKIYFESKHYKEFTIVEQGNISAIHIPLPLNDINRNLEKYSERCIDLLSPLLEQKEDIIFHLNYSTHVKLGLAARRRYKAKIVYTLHFLPDFFSFLAFNNTWNNELQTIGDVLGQEIAKSADHIITVTQFAKDAICNVFGVEHNKVTAIHNGFFNKETNASFLGKDGTMLEKFGFAPTDQIILFVGLIEPRKGLTELISAFNLVAHQCPNARLVIAGNGNYDSAMYATTRYWGRITYTGKIDYRYLEQLYQLATIGVIPSIFEQCSYVALEMMQNSLPVVVNSAPGLVELYVHQITGWIVPLINGDAEKMKLEVDIPQLAKAIMEMLCNQTLRQTIAHNSHHQWQTYHTAKQMGEKTVMEYLKIFEKTQ